mgnify:CR=1 FL=1
MNYSDSFFLSYSLPIKWNGSEVLFYHGRDLILGGSEELCPGICQQDYAPAYAKKNSL